MFNNRQLYDPKNKRRFYFRAFSSLNKYPDDDFIGAARYYIMDSKIEFSLAHKMMISDQRGRKHSSYKRWLYDSDQSKPKVTKWREQKKTASLSDAERDEPGWIDNGIEFEEMSSGDRHNHGFDVEEFFGSSS